MRCTHSDTAYRLQKHWAKALLYCSSFNQHVFIEYYTRSNIDVSIESILLYQHNASHTHSSDIISLNRFFSPFFLVTIVVGSMHLRLNFCDFQEFSVSFFFFLFLFFCRYFSFSAIDFHLNFILVIYIVVVATGTNNHVSAGTIIYHRRAWLLIDNILRSSRNAWTHTAYDQNM